MTTTITSTLTTGQILSGSENPFVVGTTGAILTTQGDWALFAPGGQLWSIWNFGTISATGSAVKAAVYVSSGSFINGGSRAQYGMTNFAALVSSSNIGVEMGSAGAKAKNFGTILAAGAGIDMLNGGLVVNGAASHPAAYIRGGSTGVQVLGSAGTVQNYGKVNGAIGVYLAAGGTITNGSTADTTALILGGIEVKESGTVLNFAAISGRVLLENGGVFVNGSPSDSSVSSQAGAVDVLAGMATIQNFGVLNPGPGGGAGVILESGQATITNRYLIQGTWGLDLQGQATVSNYGSIVGAEYGGIDLAGGGTILNFGQILNYGQTPGSFVGISVASAGTVNNEAGGNIQGSSGVVANAVLWIANEGSISGTFATGISLGGGGTIVNTGQITGRTAGVSMVIGGTLANDALASITGAVGVAANGSVSISNYGSIVGTSNAAVLLESGGTIANFGQLTGQSSGISLVNGGTITNETHGTIEGTTGVTTNAAVSISNYGSIDGSTSVGVSLGGGGRIVNLGQITGQSVAVSMANGGTLVNGKLGNAAGLIADPLGTGVSAGNGGLIANYGSISGSVGVYMDGSGSKSNVLVNAGTISGSSGLAVDFARGNAKLVLDAGASFGGIVSAGGAATSNLLELAAAAGPGSIGGVGVSITNFGTIAVDAGGSWSLSGTDSLASGTVISLASGATLAGSGTLTSGHTITMIGNGVLSAASTGKMQIGSGVAVKAGALTVDAANTLNAVGTLAGAVVDNGRINAGAGTLTLSAGISGRGAIGIDASSVLNATGPLGVATISFLAGGHETAVLGKPNAVTSTFAGFGQSTANTIDLLGIVGTKVNFSNGILAVTEAGGSLLILKMSGHYVSSQFAIGTDHHNGSNITFV